jgi:hypothetical protein
MHTAHGTEALHERNNSVSDADKAKRGVYVQGQPRHMLPAKVAKVLLLLGQQQTTKRCLLASQADTA